MSIEKKHVGTKHTVKENEFGIRVFEDKGGAFRTLVASFTSLWKDSKGTSHGRTFEDVVKEFDGK